MSVTVIKLELEDGDPKEFQVQYLKRLLKEYQPAAPSTSAFRFTYDEEGTCHWQGRFFVLEHTNGDCWLRLANVSDNGFVGNEGRMVQQEVNQYWKWIQEGRPQGHRTLLYGQIPLKLEGSKEVIVDMGKSVYEVTAKELQEALTVFTAADVMME